ncbi:alpha/beta hydrolase fold protein [Cellulomonas flavigena DSM 20109]|uniref:Alpha/beta hydrolase fold protein n=1 Tax=Cellulomonas flavigena (strain ATCC 482 / DSM 20109 / BCRC 11376 / JCM 18109 / NBRC 3775 / NCIMB 8073 / NRS 134) TaxID=446466 RepID=D5UFQ0_CELFN|nr:alpha/beta fold hydrolase [Cellulomonas flavigena]ADG73009.1 alpha/beta hydrolase fold protein [Cellulomonas flavigena DSM 20109]
MSAVDTSTTRTVAATQPPAPRRLPISQRVRLAVVRGRLRVLGVVAPRAAGAAAFRIWCTLPGGPGRRKDHRPHPGEVTTLTAPRGGRVVVETWGEGPVVYLVHGWGGWRGQLGAFVAPLVAAGHRVVAFDAPGHGDSDPGVLGPGRGTLVEAMEALEVVAAHHGDAAAVVAHSMGSTVASMAVHEGAVRTGRLVLVAPNPDFADLRADFARTFRLTPRVRRLLHAALEDFVQRPLSDFDLGPLGAAGGMPDTLVVHDLRDKETAFEVGRRVAEAWPTATLVTTDGLGHQRILRDPATVELVVRDVTAPRPV